MIYIYVYAIALPSNNIIIPPQYFFAQEMSI